MRIAFFAKSKPRTRTTPSIAAALRRAGHPLLWPREGRLRRLVGARLARRVTLARIERFRPDFVFIHAHDVSQEVFDALAPRFRTVLFTPDCWRSPLPEEELFLARRVDLLLTVARGQIAEFEAAGVRRAAYLAEAHDPRIHHPVASAGPEWQSDVAYIGKASAANELHQTRASLVPEVAKRFDTKVYGRGWEGLGITPARAEVYPEHYRLVCRGAKIVLGRDWRDDCEWYFSNRTWFTLGCEGFLLTNYAPGLEELFENHRHLVWYRSPAECLELIGHYLGRPDERRRIAAEGHAYALAHRTSDHFARDLLDLVEGRPPAFPPRRERPGGRDGRGRRGLD
jgi:Glycosyl transferases group 1